MGQPGNGMKSNKQPVDCKVKGAELTIDGAVWHLNVVHGGFHAGLGGVAFQGAIPVLLTIFMRFQPKRNLTSQQKEQRTCALLLVFLS